MKAEKSAPRCPFDRTSKAKARPKSRPFLLPTPNRRCPPVWLDGCAPHEPPRLRKRFRPKAYRRRKSSQAPAQNIPSHEELLINLN